MAEMIRASDALRRFTSVKPRELENLVFGGAIPIVGVDESDNEVLISVAAIESYVEQKKSERKAIAEAKQRRRQPATMQEKRHAIESAMNAILAVDAPSIPLLPSDVTMERKPHSIIARLARENKHWVYYLQGEKDAPIKIGRTYDLENRLNAIQNMNGTTIRLLAVEPLFMEQGFADTERRRHEEFRELRIHGEWFLPSARLIRHINATCLIVDQSINDVLIAIKVWKDKRDKNLNRLRRSAA